MSGTSVPWAAHTLHCGILRRCGICSLVPTLSQLWHCSISWDRCLCADGCNPYTCCGNQEHTVRSGCAGRAWAPTRQLQKAWLERLSPGKLLPTQLCVFVTWLAWKNNTKLIKLPFLAPVSDVRGTTSAPGDQDLAWEQDMGWEGQVGVVSVLGLMPLIEVCSVPIGKGVRSGNYRSW